MLKGKDIKDGFRLSEGAWGFAKLIFVTMILKTVHNIVITDEWVEVFPNIVVIVYRVNRSIVNLMSEYDIFYVLYLIC